MIRYKIYYLIILVMLATIAASGQLYIAPGSTMIVKGGTIFATDSLVLLPSSDLQLSNVSITKTNSPINTATGNSIERVYEISAPISFSGTAGIFFQNSELNGNTAANLQIAYDDGLATNFTTTNGSTVNTVINYVSNSFGSPASLMKITALNGGSVLPLTMIDFSAKAIGSRSLISWTTANENNLDHFMVESSRDGKTFQLLNTVKASGGSQTKTNYHLYDEHPAKSINYYRLTVYDLSGMPYHAGIRIVRFGEGNNTPTLTIYPNPATSILYMQLSFLPVGEATYRITDLSGKTVKSIKITDEKYQLTMDNLAAGIYLLTYRDQYGSKTIRFSKL